MCIVEPSALCFSRRHEPPFKQPAHPKQKHTDPFLEGAGRHFVGRAFALLRNCQISPAVADFPELWRRGHFQIYGGAPSQILGVVLLLPRFTVGLHPRFVVSAMVQHRRVNKKG